MEVGASGNSGPLGKHHPAALSQHITLQNSVRITFFKSASRLALSAPGHCPVFLLFFILPVWTTRYWAGRPNSNNTTGSWESWGRMAHTPPGTVLEGMSVSATMRSHYCWKTANIGVEFSAGQDCKGMMNADRHESLFSDDNCLIFVIQYS